MNPVLRKISQAATSGAVADLLEKHIGSEPNYERCREAYDALLARGPDFTAVSAARFAHVLMQEREVDYQTEIASIIGKLRAERL